MRVLMVVVLAAGISLAAYAAEETELGSSRYYDEGTANFFSLVTSTRVDGTVVLSTKGYRYSLTQGEKDRLQRLVRDGLRLMDIAVSNKTTIDYEKDLGQLSLSLSNGYLYTGFVTRGWDQSAVTLRFLNGGQNINMSLDRKQAQELAANLARASDQGEEILRQLRLFESRPGQVAAAISTAPARD